VFAREGAKLIFFQRLPGGESRRDAEVGPWRTTVKVLAVVFGFL